MLVKRLLTLWDRAGGIFFVLFGQAAQSIASFITSLIIARVAGQEELGFFALGYSFCFLAICLGDTLVATPYTYFSSQDKTRNQEIKLAGLLGTLIVGVLVSVLLLLSVWLGVESLRSVAFSLPLAITALLVREFYRRHLYVAGKLTKALVVDIASCSLQLLLVISLAVCNWLSASTAFVAIGLAAILPVLAVAGRCSFSESTLEELSGWLMRFSSYGRWLVLGTACHVASVQLYPWLALTGGGAANAGIFAVCVALTNLLNPLLVGLTNYFRPRLMTRYREQPLKVFLTYVIQISLLFLMPAAGFLLLVYGFGEQLLAYIYGEAYREGGSALAYMGIGVVAVALCAPLQLALLAMKAPITNVIYHGSALCVLLGLSVYCWPLFTSETLGVFYGGVNIAGLLVLLCLFWRRLVSR